MADLQLTDKADRLADKLTCFTDGLTHCTTLAILLAKWLKNITDYLLTTSTYSIVLYYDWPLDKIIDYIFVGKLVD